MALLTQKLAKQIDRFVKSGFKKGYFTDDMYEYMYLFHGKFIAHFDKHGFYAARFEHPDELSWTVRMLTCKVEKFNDPIEREVNAVNSHFLACMVKYYPHGFSNAGLQPDGRCILPAGEPSSVISLAEYRKRIA